MQTILATRRESMSSCPDFADMSGLPRLIMTLGSAATAFSRRTETPDASSPIGGVNFYDMSCMRAIPFQAEAAAKQFPAES